MKPRLLAAIATVSFSLAIAPAFAQAPPAPTEINASKLALTLYPAKDSKALKVTSPAFKEMGDIPFENTMYRGNVFPGLEWSKGPKGTQSYVLIMQDPDADAHGQPILHFTLFNIPAGLTKLDAGMTASPAGSMYGPDMRGAMRPYVGPRPPPGPKHRYHFQVFALDTILQGDPAMTWDQMKAQIAGHVLASGQLIGLGSFDPTAPKPQQRPPA